MEASTQNWLTDGRKKRQSNLELLRIVAMVMVVFHHFAVHGGFTFDRTTLSIPRFWYNFISMGGKAGVNIFILISGYFLVQNKSAKVSIRKVLKLWGQVFFYSAACCVIALLLGEDVSMEQLATAFMPMTRAAWKFASTYFVLYLIHPFLNHFLHSLEKSQYQRYLLMLLLLWCIVPTLFYTRFEGNNLIWFVTLYSLAGYYRLYGFNGCVAKHAGMIAIILAILTYGSSVVITLFGTRWAVFAGHIGFFFEAYSLPTLAISFSLFVAFSRTDVRYSKRINTVSSATFGVFLIHENAFVRPFLWNTVFRNAKFQDSALLIPYSIAVVAMVYVACTGIDLLRQSIIERPYMQLVNRNADRLSALLQQAADSLCRNLFSDESKTRSK